MSDLPTSTLITSSNTSQWSNNTNEIQNKLNNSIHSGTHYEEMTTSMPSMATIPMSVPTSDTTITAANTAFINLQSANNTSSKLIENDQLQFSPLSLILNSTKCQSDYIPLQIVRDPQNQHISIDGRDNRNKRDLEALSLSDLNKSKVDPPQLNEVDINKVLSLQQLNGNTSMHVVVEGDINGIGGIINTNSSSTITLPIPTIPSMIQSSLHPSISLPTLSTVLPHATIVDNEGKKDDSMGIIDASQAISTIPQNKNPITQTVAQKLSALFKQRLNLSSVSSSSSSIPSSSATVTHNVANSSHDSNSSLSLICHCLIIQSSNFLKDSEDDKQHNMALALSGNCSALLKHLLKWMPLLNNIISDISIAFVDVSRRIHIQFRTHNGLSYALQNNNKLIRCGATKSNAWDQSKPCGLLRDKQPELLRLTCKPTSPLASKELESSVIDLFKQMNLDCTTWWFPRSNNGITQIAVSVLPRNIDTTNELIPTVERLHQHFKLWGGEVSVEAPNCSQLTRCHLCNNLGHIGDLCPRYAGIALRLLFTHTVPYHILEQLKLQSLAREAYLGSSVDQHTPHRKVTLLFDGEDNEAGREVLFIQLQSMLLKYIPNLYEEPTFVRCKDRLKECSDCNSNVKIHSCPFSDSNRFRNGQIGLSALQISHPHVAAPNKIVASQPSSANNIPSQPRPTDGMCNSWRFKKECPRKASGEICRFKHPEDHVAQPQRCNLYDKHGYCYRRDLCNYAHLPKQVVEQQPAAAVVVSVAAAAIPQPIVAAVNVPLQASAASSTSSSSSQHIPVFSTRKAKATVAPPVVVAPEVVVSTPTVNEITDMDIVNESPPNSQRNSKKKKQNSTKRGRVDEVAPTSSSSDTTASSLSSPNSWAALTASATVEEHAQAALVAQQNSRDGISLIPAPPPPTPISSLSSLPGPGPHPSPKKSKTAATTASLSSSSLLRTPSRNHSAVSTSASVINSSTTHTIGQ